MLAARLTDLMQTALPERIRNSPGDMRRQAVLLLYAVLIADLAVLASALFLWQLGLVDTARNVLLVLPVQTAVVGLLYVTASPRFCGHVLIGLFFLELIWDYGPDDGFGVMSAALVPLAATAILGGRAGLVWTAISVFWCIGLWPQLDRFDDYSPAVAEGTAILATIIGLSAWVIESTRVVAVNQASTSLDLRRESDAAMRRFLATTFPVHVHVLGGVVTEVSPGVHTLLGVDQEALIGQRLQSLLHEDDLQVIAPLLGPDRGEGFRAELRLRHVSGRWIWAEVFGVLVSDVGVRGEDERWLFVARDTDAERHLRDRLARAQRLEGVAVLAAGLAHDFNNLLLVMRGYAELLPPSSERTAILGAADEAANLTSGLMTFGRRGHGREVGVDLCTHITGWTNMLQRLLGPSIRLDTTLVAGPVWGAINGGQLNQILLNLVTNAKDAMPDGGQVLITLDVLDLQPSQASAHVLRPGRYARICVVDSGHGMSADVLEKAVDPFFTTRAAAGGTGLGLASVYGIVAAVGGTLELESSPGAGTTVRVFLPVVDDPMAQQGISDSGSALTGIRREPRVADGIPSDPS